MLPHTTAPKLVLIFHTKVSLSGSERWDVSAMETQSWCDKKSSLGSVCGRLGHHTECMLALVSPSDNRGKNMY